MKTKFTVLLFYFHRILYGLIYFSMKYLRAESLFHAIFLIAYIFSSTLFIFSVFNEFNVSDINTDLINYLDELDCPTELMDQSCKNVRENSSSNVAGVDDNILFKFLNLFKGDNVITGYVIPEELRNNYYIENRATYIYGSSGNGSGNGNGNQFIDSLNGTNNIYMYHYQSAYLQKMSSYVYILEDTLKDLKIINEIMKSAKH